MFMRKWHHFGDWPKTLIYFTISLHITFYRLQRVTCRFDLTSAWSNTFSFFVAVSFLKADHHMAHDCIGRSGVASTWFKCATASKITTVSSHCTVYWSCGFCGYVKGMRLLFVSFAAFFLFLSRSIQFEILMSVSWNFKGIDIWFSVHCLQSRESRAHFLPSSRLLDLEKIAVLSGVVFSFVTAALKSRWSHSTGVQITQQQALKNKTAGDFCAV